MTWAMVPLRVFGKNYSDSSKSRSVTSELKGIHVGVGFNCGANKTKKCLEMVCSK